MTTISLLRLEILVYTKQIALKVLNRSPFTLLSLRQCPIKKFKLSYLHRVNCHQTIGQRRRCAMGKAKTMEPKAKAKSTLSFYHLCNEVYCDLFQYKKYFCFTQLLPMNC